MPAGTGHEAEVEEHSEERCNHFAFRISTAAAIMSSLLGPAYPMQASNEDKGPAADWIR